MPLSFAHICIKTKDINAAEAFYTGILGFPKVFDFEKDGEKKGCYLEIGERQYIEIFEDPNVAPMNSMITHFCLETDDIDMLYDKLNQAGVDVTPKKTGSDGSHQIWFTDPDGLRIEAHEYTEESSQFTGKTAIMNW